MAPKIITLTPNPHPTTVDSTKDPIINPDPTPPRWKSGRPPGPSSSPGCKGCGKPCVLFCDPNCPWCPPGIFTGGGGGDDPNDPEESSSRSKSTATVTHTVMFDVMQFDDTWESGYADLVDVSSFYSSMYPPPTPTPTPSKTTPPPPPPPPPSPTATCYFWDAGGWYTFEVFNIQGWADDDAYANKLHKEEGGCGALTGWKWGPGSLQYARAIFNLPFFMKAGCVERAIVSAGGPKLSCKGQGILVGNPPEEPVESSKVLSNEFVTPVFSQEQREEFEKIYGTNSTFEPYVPETWTTTSVPSPP